MPAATEPVSELISFAPATASRMKHAARPGGDGTGAVVSQQRSRRPATPELFSIDQSRLHQLALIDWAAGRTRAAEEFRIIKRQLLERAANPERGRRSNNLTMITSARPGEGRTFTALNLAISVAMERKYEVLLIDACGGKNSVTSVVRRPPALGWLDLVEDPTLDIDSAVLETDIEHLSMMVPGERQGGAAEPLASGNMQRLLEGLSVSNRKRLVLIDAPSCLDTSDPSNLAYLVGQTVLVIEAHTTQQQKIEAALELLHPCANKYLVLNKSRTG
jgi:Mrp family chromosome partitioning ATPase